MILLFSDIHANRRAAKEIEKLAPCFEDILFAGDICGFGKDFKYCIDMFKDLKIKSVLGNHDRLVLSDESLDTFNSKIADSIKYTKKKIKEPELEYLKNLPTSRVEYDMYITHTFNRDGYILRKSDCVNIIDKIDHPITMIGHTHIQLELDFGDKILINPGSITKGRKGKPRGYAILDKDKIRFVELKDIKGWW